MEDLVPERVLWAILYMLITYIIYMVITIKSLLYSIEERIKDLESRIGGR
jgi:cell division protein FtsL